MKRISPCFKRMAQNLLSSDENSITNSSTCCKAVFVACSEIRDGQWCLGLFDREFRVRAVASQQCAETFSAKNPNHKLEDLVNCVVGLPNISLQITSNFGEFFIVIHEISLIASIGNVF
eukprot:51200_1